MDFKVITHQDGNHDDYTDPARYQLDGGVLMVWTGNEKRTYGPAGWVAIVEPFDDNAEIVGGYSGV